ncbi:uncharacterized protein LOC115434916 [Sphaeramia orbicularis]|uniref:Uncharacterized LOC115434916 n=1 Tax=Sphaeramia orbicularis TaxID=375764 RepID=A0A672ZN95_9TELE|nr:uncharacterized protein LOC115434916 [Sphaeramia orbicularis]
MMKITSILSLLFISGFCYFTLCSSDFHLIKRSMNYEEAKNYCRNTFTDLASVHNLTDMNNLIKVVSNNAQRAWIGLEIADVRTWYWSRPNQKLDFLNWREGEPKINDEDKCGAMDEDGKWFESDCDAQRSFVCHRVQDNGSHIFVAGKQSWRNAQSHCRDLLTELVSINSAEENEAVKNLSQNVWIGLFKDLWKWSDGSNSSFRFWKPGQPNYRNDQECVAGVFRDTGQWNDLRCTTRRSFVCRGANKEVLTTTLETSTQEPLTTNPLRTSETTPPGNSSQDITTTVHFSVVASTNQSNPANITSGTTTATVSEPVSSSANTELNNVTTQLVNITAVTPLTSTVQVTQGFSVSQYSTQSETTLEPTENSHSLTPGRIVLIQKNMTWMEAMSYCRQHHIDLVYITTKDIQQKVAEKAKNASSPHVWLGLRYACNFNFWFWTRSTLGCYQNWAPGQGSEGMYGCGTTGAIEATGGQQWVGLPQTEKLNFICFACGG